MSRATTVLTFCTTAIAAAGCGAGRVLAAGMTLLGAGLLLLARTDVGVLVPSSLCAAGIGCSFVSTTITATTAVDRADSGLVSGLVNTSFQVGGALGLAVLAAVADDPQGAFALAGGVALAGAAIALAVLVPRSIVRDGSRRVRRDGASSRRRAPGAAD